MDILKMLFPEKHMFILNLKVESSFWGMELENKSMGSHYESLRYLHQKQ